MSSSSIDSSTASRSSMKRKLTTTTRSEAHPAQPCFCLPSWSSTTTNNNNNNSSNHHHSQADQLIARDLHNMTLEERQQVYEEVHGVEDVLQESSAVVNQGLELMDRELHRRRRRNNNSKERAVDRLAFLAPRRLQDREFQLQFLRCHQYQGILAAQKCMAYLDFVYQYFGLDGLLARRLTQAKHLSSKDQKMMRMGSLQPLLMMDDTTDRSGRPILMFLNRYSPEFGMEEMIRTYLYIIMNVLRDPLAQLRGVVVVSWHVGPKNGYIPPITPAFWKASTAFYSCVPLRISAFHFCYDDWNIHPMMEFVKVVVGKHGRVRFRVHFGSLTECSYSLLSYGIDPSKFPLDVTTNGQIQVDAFLKYLKRLQQEEEQEQQDADYLVLPRETDILLGRGLPYRIHPGNRNLLQFVQERWDEYNQLPRHAKMAQCQVWTRQLLLSGLRFLKRADKHAPWQVVSQQEAVQKVAHTFRNQPVLERYHWQRRILTTLPQDNNSDDDEEDGDLLIGGEDDEDNNNGLLR